VCRLIFGSAIVIVLVALVIVSPELFQYHTRTNDEPAASQHASPPGMHAAHGLHSAHKNLARKHETAAGASSTLHGTGGFFTAEASTLDLIDKTVSPCSDFYEHACGMFTMQPLPGDHDEWLYAFDGVKGRVARRMRSILSSPTAEPAGSLYRSCIDDQAIERAGIAPLTQFLLESQMSSYGTNLTDAQTLVHTVANLHKINSKAFFFWNVGADADSSTQVLYL